MDKHICVMSELSSWIPKKVPNEKKPKQKVHYLCWIALLWKLHFTCFVFSFLCLSLVQLWIFMQRFKYLYNTTFLSVEMRSDFCALCSIPLLLGRTDSLCKASMLLNQFCPSMVLLGSLHTSQNDCHWVPCGPRLFSMRTWPGGKAMIFKSSAVSCPGWKRRKSVCLSSVLCS